MKIVIPVGALHIGGGCRVLADTANALHRRGHDVTIVIPEEAPIEYKLDCAVVKVPALQSAYIPYGDIVLANFYTTFQPAFEAWPLQCVRLSLGFEPLWAHDVDYAISTYTQGVPVISISHWLDDQIYQVSGQRSHVVNLGIERKIFHPKGKKGKHRRKIILYIARDPAAGYALKGYDDFVAAMHHLKHICGRKFTVYMVCPERVLPLDGIAHRTFQPTSDRALAHLYRAADVFVSTSWYEGFALPPLEAMSCGTPVVTTNSGGILDFCTHRHSAYITAPNQPEQLAKGIKRMMYSRRLKRHVIDNGRISAKKHTKGRFERKIVHALEHIHAARNG